MEVKKPIFVVGSGRSGSTIFHEVICKHPQISYLSGLLGVYPKALWANKLVMKLINIPILGSILYNQDKPSEVFNFWEHHVKGFRRPCRDLNADDLTIKNKNKLDRLFSNNLSESRDKLLIKITGWPRIGYLQALYPDAKFITINRDPRAIVNSILNVYFWDGWEGPQSWRWGNLSEKYEAEWLKHDKSFVALAAIGYKIFNEALQNTKNLVDKENYLEVDYEDICVDQLKEYRNVIDFCGLKPSKSFEKKVMQTSFRNTNYKWQKELTKKQKNILEDVLSPLLEKYK